MLGMMVHKLFPVMTILFLFIFWKTGFSSNVPILKKAIQDQIVSVGEEFLFDLPSDTFESSTEYSVEVTSELPSYFSVASGWLDEAELEDLIFPCDTQKPTFLQVYGSLLYVLMQSTDSGELVYPCQGLYIFDLSQREGQNFVEIQQHYITKGGGLWFEIHEYPDDGILMYLAHRDFSILNITDPYNISTLSNVDESTIFAQSLGCDDDGGYCYVTEDNQRLRIVDVSDKSNPVQVGTYESTSTTRQGSAYCGGDILIMNDYNNDFQVLNVSSKSSPTFLSRPPDTGMNVQRVWCSGDLVFAATSITQLKTYNITNLTSPKEIHTYACGGCGGIYGFHFDIQEDKLLLTGSYGLQYFTYSTSTTLGSFADFRDRGFTLGTVTSEWYVVTGQTTGAGFGVFGYNASDLTEIQLSSSKIDRYWHTWAKNDYGGNCFIGDGEDKYTYLIDLHQYGFRIIHNSKIVHSEDIEGLGTPISIGCAVDLVYLIVDSKLHIYNVSDISFPTPFPTLSYSGNTYSGMELAYFSDDGYPTIMYIGSSDGYWVFNITDPSNPFLARKIEDEAGYKSGHWIQRDDHDFGYWLGYFDTGSEKKIRVFNMTSPTNGSFLYESFGGSSLSTMIDFDCHKPSGKICSMGGGNDGIQVYDTSDLSNITSMYYQDYLIDGMCAVKKLIWTKKVNSDSYRLLTACSHSWGFNMYNFTPPDTMVHIDSRSGNPSVDNTNRIVQGGDYVVLTDTDFGITTYRWNKKLAISGIAELEDGNCTIEVPIQITAMNDYGNSAPVEFSVFVVSSGQYSLWCNNRGVCGGESGGKCFCDDGYYGEDCSISACFGKLSNITEEVCSGHGQCLDTNLCICFENYYDQNCNVTECHGFFSNETSEVCSGHGVCIITNNCTCFDNYNISETCERFECFGYVDNHDDVCSGHGFCTDYNECDCDSSDYYGDGCELWKCNNISSWDLDHVCNGNGVCVSSDFCLCRSGYSSLSIEDPCNEWYCGNIENDDPKVCNSRGPCVKSHVCECGDYEGDYCDIWSCGYAMDSPLTCSGNGNCRKPRLCDCDAGFSGEQCSTNTLLLSVMMPILIVAGIFGITFGFFIIGCLLCCIMEFVLVFCCSVSVLVAATFSLLFRVKKFERLKNFDLLLREQEMEDDRSTANLKINKSLFIIPFEEVKTMSVLGEGGSSSVVFLAVWKGKKCAFKCFRTRMLMGSQEKYDEFEREVEILSSVSHPNIIRFFGASLKPPRVGILMEFAKNGEILDYIQKFRSLSGVSYPIFQKVRLLSEVCNAMEYLHVRNILHRDLKSENILLDSREEVKLMDFGLSRIVDRMSVTKTMRIGTNVYMAPEILTASNYSEKCDVFSFGILAFVIFSESSHPYGENDEFNIEMKVANDPTFRPRLEELEAEELNEEVDWIKKLMVEAWEHDPDKRPSFKQISRLLDTKNSKLKKEFDGDEKNDGGRMVNSQTIEEVVEEEEEEEEVVVDEDYSILSKNVLIGMLKESKREIQILKGMVENKNVK